MDLPRPRLFYASTEADADVFYLFGCSVPDAFLLVQMNGRTIALLSQLEFTRVQRNSRLSEVRPLEKIQDALKEELEVERPRLAQIAERFLQELGVSAVEIGARFPAGLALSLQALGLGVRAVAGSLVADRLRKTAAEAACLREGNDASAAGIARAKEILSEASVDDGLLVWQGETLSSEQLRAEIDIACLRRGAVAHSTICAGGDQACDPHEIGHGPLRARELIIVDVFPRVTAHGYHGDMTRSFLKGEASEAQGQLVESVRQAQKTALGLIKAGVDAKDVHQAVVDFFENAGYETKENDGVWRGFFHSTGHGLGLEVHEEPRVSKYPQTLEEGMVITVEPGLYYPGLGGCRIEDVVRVTRDGCELLSSAPYEWQLP